MAILIRKPKLSLSRRQMLTQLAAGTSAFVMVGCGDKAQAQLPPAECESEDTTEADISALNAEVYMEWGAIAAYTGALDILTPPAKPFAEIFRDHHKQHAALAIEELKSLGAPEPERAELGELPELVDDVAVLRYALALEQQACNAYLGILEQIKAGRLRYNAGNVLGCEFSHVVAIRAALKGLDLTLLGEAASPAFITDLN